jgi:DNA helicase-2/ATP-dependent DNA helicase PcrA
MHPDWENEIHRLDTVRRTIERELVKKMSHTAEYKKKMRMINEEMWDEVGVLSGLSTLDATPTFLQEINLLKQNMAEAAKNSKEIRMLERQYNSPYFGRIDFQEDHREIENIYIGIFGFHAATGEIFIYDWRAPISSMFYDFEPGRAFYESPSGYIEGALTLKRQYRVEKSELKLMFDSTVAIQDNILQDILAQSASNRMKTIVSTIQKEQNRVIRYEGKRVLAVQGPAGGGKTSIALHRAAYLLYHHRNTIQANNIRLYTPNGVFGKYISSVLPELGEEDIPCITLPGLAQATLGDLFRKYESYGEMMEWQLSQRCASGFVAGARSRFESIRFKTSKRFAATLEEFARVFENNIILFHDIRNEAIVFADKKELDELFHKSYSNMPIAKRLSLMETRVTARVKEYEKQRQREITEELSNREEYMDDSEIKARSFRIVRSELEPVKSEIKKMLSLDIRELYRALFKNFEVWDTCGDVLSEEARAFTVDTLGQGILYFEDQAAILYLMFLLGMLDRDKETGHVIIDEAQDYSEVAFKLFSRLYPKCSITLLGDLAQNINPFIGIGSLQLAGEILAAEDFAYFELDKSYRSTVEIMEFASRVNPANISFFGRNGKAPEIATSESLEKVCELITNFIREMQAEGFISIAVICRTLSRCNQVYTHLCKNLSINLVENGDDEIPSGAVIIPSYFAKGLEFDAVIAVVASVDEYLSDEDQLFYTVCTRALHRLLLCSVEKAGVLTKIGYP